MNEYLFDDMRIGLSHSFDVVITEKMMQCFLELSGDCNPLHIDCYFAIERKFKEKVVYGMLTSAFYSTLAGVYLPGKYCLLQGIDISFHKPVYIGDRLTVCGEVSYINEVYRQIEIKAFIKNEEGNKVSKATLKVSVNE